LYKPRLYHLPKLVKFHRSFCNFILVRIAFKIFTQLLSYIFCTYVRRLVHEQIRKRRCGKEKSGRFVFKKLVLFTLTLGLTTPYSLGILVWNFYQTFVIVSIEFWLRLEPQIRSTRFALNFLFITATAEKKICLCMKLLDFFPRWILIRLTSNLSRFVPNSIKILTWNFRKKNIWVEFFINLVQTKAILYQNLWNVTIVSVILFWFVLCCRNLHNYFHILLAPR